MNIGDLFKGSVEDRADFLQGAMTSKMILDAHIEAGFTRKESMEILIAMMKSTLEAGAMTQFMERQAMGEFNPDGDL